MPVNLDDALITRILPIRMLILDVDGVLTDGRVIYTDEGSEIKEFDVQDGHGIKLLQRAGIEVVLITGRYCKAVAHRAEGLGIKRVYQDIKVKLDAYKALLSETRFNDDEVAYMGDDLIDLPVMRRVGLAISVPNASKHVLPYAHFVTTAHGGHGACREACETILQVQGLWDKVTERYFRDPHL